MVKKLGILSFIFALASVALSAHPAAADEQFDLTVAKGEIDLVTKGNWHVNKDYPWKVDAGGSIFDKSKFVFTETSVKVSGVPHGAAKLKGAVCNGPQCMPFSKEIDVQ
jgi:hypothetical protein